ncbi:class I SAM-dependent methyltransferase [Lamprobacter modestohalophilus]|uniref:class I SAM-dependent methyltransferase n=1 Tax=Lamprobacter modestohalophilus TaxID=1064514 RepID=UPI002ADEB32F|nr:class I SAM-dependent methyltransferase [Lamprobacter modestohalophilus]MEA1051636.1 class I SAM-dependent methyltransferase [Lamprobacter modestohalophilus]
MSEIDGGVKAELDELVRLYKKYLWADEGIQSYVEKQGVFIEPARFYSQLPTKAEIRLAFEYQDDFMAQGGFFQNLEVNDQEMLRRLGAWQPYAKEFDPPSSGDKEDPKSFYWQNPAFSFSDAMAYWCMLRSKQPSTVVEIGSGFSTLIAAQALEANKKGRLICIEPYPKPWLSTLSAVELFKRPIQDFSIEEFTGFFESGDILFIDSTHTVKVGSDCLWIYLILLPSIPVDLTIHVHDISLPFGVNQQRALDVHVHWIEQYLLLAYWLDNPRIQLLYSSSYLKANYLAELSQLMGGKYAGGVYGSIRHGKKWLMLFIWFGKTKKK